MQQKNNSKENNENNDEFNLYLRFGNPALITEKEFRNYAVAALEGKYQKYKISSGILGTIGILLLLLLVIDFTNSPSSYLNLSTLESKVQLTVLLLSILLLNIIGCFLFFYKEYLVNKLVSKYKFHSRKNPVNNNNNRVIYNTIEKSNFDILSDINIEHLNKYYKQTYDQCDNSFFVAKMASNASYVIFAFAIIIFFVSIFTSTDEKSKLIMFGVTTGSAVIVKIISSLYFYMYNNSVSKLGEYHDKLYTIQNILISLELSNQIEDAVKKDDIKADMIKRLLENHNEHKHEDIKKVQEISES